MFQTNQTNLILIFLHAQKQDFVIKYADKYTYNYILIYFLSRFNIILSKMFDIIWENVIQFCRKLYKHLYHEICQKSFSATHNIFFVIFIWKKIYIYMKN